MEQENTQLPQTQESVNIEEIFKDVKDSDVRVVFHSDPFSDPDYSVVDAGYSVGAAVYHYAPERVDYATVALNGRFISKEEWEIILQEGDVIEIAVRMGDPVTASLAAVSWVTVGVTSLVVGAGLLVGYFLFRPDTPDGVGENERLPSIRGMRNSMRRHEPHRMVIGRRQVAPDYLAEPYTFNRGDDEWFSALFTVGYGPLSINPNSLKIGDTPLSDFEHQIAILDWYNTPDVTGGSLQEFLALLNLRRLWPADVVQETLGLRLETGQELAQTSANDTDRISIDVIYPRGISSNERGKRGKGRGVTIGHEYICPETGKRIKVAKIRDTGMRHTLGNRGRPNALNLYQMTDGSYRVSIRERIGGSRYPWDGMGGDGVGSASRRHLRVRSYTFPSEAIIATSGDIVFIDPDILDGKPRTIYNREEGEEVPAGTWSASDQFGVISTYGNSPRQKRDGFTYAPISADTGEPVSGNIQTYTTKLWPNESPDTAELVDEVVITAFKSSRNFGTAGFKKLIGYEEKPEIRYVDQNGDSQQVKNFYPVVIALNIKATDQISGTLENFNLECNTVVPVDWNHDWRNFPDASSLKMTQNPAELYRWVIQGPYSDSPIGIDKINLDSLAEWRDECNKAAPDDSQGNPLYSGPQWRASFEWTDEKSMREALQAIAFTGRAEFTYDTSDGYGVVQKIRQDYPVQVFTPKNSWDFGSTRQFPETVDGIRFEFDNEDEEYQQDEDIFYDPRIAPQDRVGKFEAVTLLGTPDHDMAYRLARLQFYEQNLQRERYQFKTDIEGLIPKRGSLIEIQSDVIDVGLGSGRVLSVEGTSVLVDETIDLEDGVAYGVVFKKLSGDITEAQSATWSESTQSFVFSSNMETEVSEGDFISYGTLGSETLKAIVTSIDYARDLECTISCVNYDEELFNIDEDPDQDAIPEFITGLSDRVEFIAPNPPTLDTFDNEGGIDIQKQQIYLDVDYPSQLDSDASQFSFQVRTVNLDLDEWELPDDEGVFEDPLDYLVPEEDLDTDWSSAGTIPADESLFTFNGIDRGTAYRFRARTRSRGNLFSGYSSPVNVIVPFSLPPENVQDLEFEDTRQGVILSWSRVVDPDFADYEIRTDTNIGEIEGLITNTVSLSHNVGYNDEDVTYYVYARTIFDGYSEEPAEVLVPSYYIPTTPVARTQSDSEAGTRIRWNPIAASSFFKPEYVDFYEVRTNTDIGDDDGLVTTTSAQSTNIGFVNDNNLITYYVYGVSVAGFYSPTPLELTPESPDSPEIKNPRELIGVPIDNSVSLDWQEPLNITYPVKTYEVEQLAPGRVEFESIGTFNSTYANIVEREGGGYTFRVRTVDQGNNRSNWVSTNVRVFDPTDFVLFYEQEADLTEGVHQNTVTGTHEGEAVVYGPVLDTKTWDDTIVEAAAETGVNRSLVTWFDKSNDVGPFLPQFTPQSVDGDSRYTQTFDVFEGQSGTGLFIQNTSIKVDLLTTQITPSNPVNFRVFLEWSEDEVTWSTPIEATQAFIDTPFRYVRVSVYFDTNSDTSGLPFARIDGIDIVADVKQITDQGEADIVGADDPNFPTEISFRTVTDSNGDPQNYFIDVLSVNGTVEEFDPDDLQNPNRVTVLLSNGKIDNKGEIITVKTEFEYLDENDNVVLDKFRAYAQGPDGRFIPARISWIARGIANIVD